MHIIILLLILGFRTMDKVQKPSINECCTPSSEPYRIILLFTRKTVDAGKGQGKAIRGRGAA
jgi:hypothetical protein